MHGMFPQNDAHVIVQPDIKTVQIGHSDDQLDNDLGSRWFADAMRALGINAEMLHVLTGAELRSCYRYVSDERKPPAYIVIKLITSEVGPQFMAYIAAAAPWWRELKAASDLTKQFKIERRP
jgi:hypothetical protein